MTFPQGSSLYSQSAGIVPAGFLNVLVLTSAPTSATIYGPAGLLQVGQRALVVNTSIWELIGFTSSATGLSANWVEIATSSGGVLSVTGTANQILASPTTGNVVLSLIGPYTPSTYTAHSVLLGEGNSSIGIVAPTANTGAVLQNNSGADPTYSTATYPATTTANDILYSSATNTVGQITTANSAALVTNSTGVPSMTSSSTNGQVLLGATTGTPAFGTLTTSTGVAFTTGAASLALDVKSGGFKVNAASTGATLAAQNSYTVTQAAQTSFALPATANPGDMFIIASGTGNTSGWIITQGASQEIWSGSSHTTNGATGTLAGAIHTSVLLMCTVANTDFIVLGNTTGYTFT